MKILELSSYYPPYRGGQEAYVRNLSEHLASMGHHVTVLTTTSAMGPASSEGGRVDVIGEPSSVTLLNNPVTWSVWRHKSLLESADVIHAHNEHSFMALSAALLRNRIDKPFALTLHGRLVFGNTALDAFERLYASTFGNAILKRADAIFVDSQIHRRELEGRGVPSDRVTVVPNAVNVLELERYLSKDAYREVRHEMGLQQNTKIVLFVGRLIRRKGIATLLSAFAKCITETDEAHLVVVGDGPLKPLCEQFKSGRRTRGLIKIISSLRDSDLYRLYQAADLLVLPSLSEGCPTVLIEAMFFGCPLIASDIAGIRDHFAGSSTLIPPEDVDLLSDAITAGLQRDRRGDAAKREARDIVISRFDWGKTVKVYDAIFRSLVLQVRREVHDS